MRRSMLVGCAESPVCSSCDSMGGRRTQHDAKGASSHTAIDTISVRHEERIIEPRQAYRKTPGNKPTIPAQPCAADGEDAAVFLPVLTYGPFKSCHHILRPP